MAPIAIWRSTRTTAAGNRHCARQSSAEVARNIACRVCSLDPSLPAPGDCLPGGRLRVAGSWTFPFGRKPSPGVCAAAGSPTASLGLTRGQAQREASATLPRQEFRVARDDPRGRNPACVADLDRLTTGHVLFNTAAPRAKWKHLKRDPRVTVEVHSHDNPYEYVTVTGTAELDEDEKAANRHIDKMSLKYRGEPTYQNHRPGERHVIVRITPSASTRSTLIRRREPFAMPLTGELLSSASPSSKRRKTGFPQANAGGVSHA